MSYLMEYAIETAPLETIQTNCLIVGVYLDNQLSPSATSVDQATHGIISKVLNRGDINGKIGETVLINAIPESFIERILLVGLGENKALTGKNYIKAVLAAINALKKTPIKNVVVALLMRMLPLKVANGKHVKL